MKRMVLALLIATAAATARADVLTVGPTGGFGRVEDALAHALSAPAATHQIRVAEGVYDTRLAVPPGCCTGKTLIVIGGWSSDFSSYRYDPGSTVLDGGLNGRVLDLPSMTSGTFALLNLTIRRGRVKSYFTAPGRGGGLRAVLSGSARVVLSGVHVRSNEVAAVPVGHGPGGVMADANGAGVAVEMRDAAVLQVDGSEFVENVATAAPGSVTYAAGGGLYLRSQGGTATVRSSRFAANRFPVDGKGDALYADIEGPGQLTIADTRFESGGLAFGSTTYVRTSGTGGTGIAASIARCRFLGNATSKQLEVDTFGTRGVAVSDTVVANGRLDGVVARTWTAGRVHLTNLTVTGNGGIGVRTTAGPGALTLYNTISWANGVDLAGTRTAAGFNFIGGDPLFADPAAGDFGLTIASSAIDVGTNTPPGGLGANDAAGQPRVWNGRVDAGAFERAY